jgi:arylformamidase
MTTNNAMDAEFSLDSVAGLEALFARRSAAALDALWRFSVQRGLAYGTGPAERLNVFPAQGGTSPAPVQVFIHGGFWKSLDADLFSFLAPGFVPKGAALVVIDYPLMPGVRMAEITAACQRALTWVRANAAHFNGDPDRVFVSGNSAGGHLVAEVMDRMPADALRGGTAISGVYDLEPVTRSFQNDDLQFTKAELTEFSPLRRDLQIKAPLLVAVGADETAEFLRQSQAFAAQCGTTSMEVPGTNHISVLLDALAVPGHPLNAAVLCQMRL